MTGDGVVEPDVVEAKVIAIEIGPVLAHAVARFTFAAFLAFALWLLVAHT